MNHFKISLTISIEMFLDLEAIVNLHDKIIFVTTSYLEKIDFYEETLLIDGRSSFPDADFNW